MLALEGQTVNSTLLVFTKITVVPKFFHLLELVWLESDTNFERDTIVFCIKSTRNVSLNSFNLKKVE